jgi:hypothetical protein
MFLIPFIYKKTNSIYTTHLFNIFLNRGNLFLQIEQDDIIEFCKLNGIYFTNMKIIDNNCYIEIDSKKTSVQDFYSYFENSDAECWRKFILIGNYDEDFIHINSTNPDFIQPILKDILTGCLKN